jgi:hypothetical protein
MQELLQRQVVHGENQLLVEVMEMMDYDHCWEGCMQLLVEMAGVMMDDDCRWEGQMQLQVVHPDPSPLVVS